MRFCHIVPYLLAIKSISLHARIPIHTCEKPYCDVKIDTSPRIFLPNQCKSLLSIDFHSISDSVSFTNYPRRFAFLSKVRTYQILADSYMLNQRWQQAILTRNGQNTWKSPEITQCQITNYRKLHETAWNIKNINWQ